MKITSFSPLIMTNDSENAGKVFEAFGFSKKHTKQEATEKHDSGFRMKDADGHSISIGQVHGIPRDMMAVQMNVDNFDEAIDTLSSFGFKNLRGEGDVINTGSSLSAVMVAPSGFAINVVYHIKNR